MAAGKAGEKHLALVLLAAGASVRLGGPKQLLTYQGQSLINHSIENAVACGAQPVVVVLGAGAQESRTEIKERTAQVIVNEDWREGMASSTRCGIRSIVEIAPCVE